jgi:acetyl-CoA carboxylase carboxyl transferase subunit beta
MSSEEQIDEQDESWFHRSHGGQVPGSQERNEELAGSGRWTKCDGCGQYLRSEELETSARVCPGCAEHHRIDGLERLGLLVDPGSFGELDDEVTSVDPLTFTDSKSYASRLVAAVRKTGRASAFVAGSATLDGRPVQIGTFLFSFMGGSMGSAVGEKVTRLFERGLATGTPVICISASGGARMQEGVLSLMQMARSTAALGRLRAAGLPYISVLTHPTTGGVAASFAMLGDVILAEPKALIGFAGPRVIEQTIRQVLPEGFQRSEYLLEHGMVDQIVDRRELRGILSRLLSLLLD